jgi:hypothetical protein
MILDMYATLLWSITIFGNYYIKNIVTPVNKLIVAIDSLSHGTICQPTRIAANRLSIYMCSNNTFILTVIYLHTEFTRREKRSKLTYHAEANNKRSLFATNQARKFSILNTVRELWDFVLICRFLQNCDRQTLGK